MLKYVMAAMAVLCLVGCVTPMPIADQERRILVTQSLNALWSP